METILDLLYETRLRGKLQDNQASIIKVTYQKLYHRGIQIVFIVPGWKTER